MTDRIALVIGGAIAGPAMALFLARSGFRPIVFEAHEYDSDIGGGLQMAPNGMHVLSQLGLSDGLRQAGVESEEFCFENQFGKILARIPNGPASRYEIPAIHIRRSILHGALLNDLRRRGIVIHYSRRLKHIVSDDNQVIATFDDGSTASGSIIIGVR